MKLRANPTHCPLLYHAARRLGVDRVTIKRAINGKRPNPALVTRYRDYVISHLDKLTLSAASGNPEPK